MTGSPVSSPPLPTLSGQVASFPPGVVTSPDTNRFAVAQWLPAPTFSTVGRCVTEAGWFNPSQPHCDLDSMDWWFRSTQFPASETLRWLQTDGLSVGAQVFADDQLIFTSESAHLPVSVSVPLDTTTVSVRFPSLLSQLDSLRSVDRAHRARWRTRLVRDQRLRLVRTPLLGRMPGWNPPLPVIGSHGPLVVRATRKPIETSRSIVRRADGSADLTICALIDLPTATETSTIRVHISGGDNLAQALQQPTDATVHVGEALGQGELTPLIATAHFPSGAFREWWPHTHGTPATSLVTLSTSAGEHQLARLAFRDITLEGMSGVTPASETGRSGAQLVVNATRVFARGANWIPLSAADPFLVGPSLRAALLDYVAAGMNILRVAGTTVIPPEELLDACDELGILVWHDLLFANLDVPLEAPGRGPVLNGATGATRVEANVDQPAGRSLRDLIAAEVAFVASRASSHGCVAVLCGGSEVEQQSAMAGATPEILKTTLGRTVLAELCSAAAPNVAYVTSSPTSAPGTDEVPHHNRSGISHYFGVSAYRRPLLDARTSEVGFATECLAFANVPTAETVDALMGDEGPVVHHPLWKQRVPRDRGAGWDFDDVRDAMTQQLFNVSPTELRWVDPAAALDLGRVTSVEAIDATLTEWRRGKSNCGGAIVWTGRDLWDGAGWGLTEASGTRKAAWYGFARRAQPVIVGLTDEGLNGVDVHLVNDTGTDLVDVELDLTAWAETGPVLRASRLVTLTSHSAIVLTAASLFQDFRDLTGVYAFGPATIDHIRARIVNADGAWISDAHLWPTGRPHAPRRGDSLTATEISAPIGRSLDRASSGSRWIEVGAPAGAFGVRIEGRGWTAGDAWFHLAPGDTRVVELQPIESNLRSSRVVVRALSCSSSVTLQLPDSIATSAP